jgi:hypothetical protein
MPRNISSTATDVASRIQQLLSERQQHEQAIQRLDQILNRVGAALGTGGAGAPARRGRPPKAASAQSAPTSGRRRRRFAVSGEQSVINFVKQQGKPTTQQVKKHWQSEGRGGTSDNVLSKLVREKRLKRAPLKGQRGSEYSVA